MLGIIAPTDKYFSERLKPPTSLVHSIKHSIDFYINIVSMVIDYAVISYEFLWVFIVPIVSI
jgi:hypothetical protein